MANRLRASMSPYLQQHRDNPVEWWEWGDDAFDEAARRDVPVLLSVGYAACHWCHVMAHESFEDEQTAALMNAGFVNVKVDREERPDVDATYMAAVQALTGQGGWPMTVFLTPAGKPFYAGTYFPPRPMAGRPSFRQVLRAVGEAWDERRDEASEAGERIAAALSGVSAPTGGAPLDADAMSRAVTALARDEDRVHGGFGGAPKFPPSMVLEWLLRHGASDAETATLAAEMAGRTLHAMARSGMYDQLGGGFARYAVDAGWVVPHFEKMLYDNALLARVYLHWWRLTGEPTGARIALETCDFMLRDLGTPEGGFASSLDADTDGVEGATYSWTPSQLSDVLGEDDGLWAAALLEVTDAGTFEHGTSTLQLARDPWADGDGERWQALRARLSEARAARPQPGRDDKVVLAWNGLAIAALAETGALLDRPDLVTAATRCAAMLIGVHIDEGRALRVSRDGRAGAAPAVLEDLGDLAEGLLALSAATGEWGWGVVAGDLLDRVLADFVDDSGALVDTSLRDRDQRLDGLGPGADLTDNAYPSGTSAAASALLSLSALTGEQRYREVAERALAATATISLRAPRFTGWSLAASEALADGPREIAVIGPDDDQGRDRLHRVALAATAPGAVVAVGEPDAAAPPLLMAKPLVAGAAAAYVCRHHTCQAPVTDPDALADQIGAADHGD